jgi:hypothetical protein
LPDDRRARRVGETRQFVEMLLEEVTRVRPLPRCTDEDGALDGRSEGNQVACDGLSPNVSGSNPP